MKAVLVILSVVLACVNIYGQSVKEKENDKLSYSIFAAGGRSIFQSDIEGPSKFPTAEIRVGGSVTFKIANQFDVLTRVDIGVKLKKEKINKPGQPYSVTGPFIELDEMANLNHYFFEIPVMIQYRFPIPNINAAVGINYRKFFNQDYVNQGMTDPFSGKNEIGAIGKLAYRLNDKFTIGAEYCIALNKLWGVGGFYDNIEYRMKVKNQFAQVTIDYKLYF